MPAARLRDARNRVEIKLPLPRRDATRGLISDNHNTADPPNRDHARVCPELTRFASKYTRKRWKITIIDNSRYTTCRVERE